MKTTENNLSWVKLFDRINSHFADANLRDVVYALVADAYKAGEEDGYTQGYKVADDKWRVWFNRRAEELENETE